MLKVHCESFHHSMRDLNNDCRLPLINGDNNQSCKEVVRRTMLEHEAVFKTQVSELHRVYRTQKDMMHELKRKQSSPVEATNENDFRRWKTDTFPSMSVVEDNGHSPMKGSISQGYVGQNGAESSKNGENLEVRPMKVRKKMIDLCLPADEYIDDNEEVVELRNHSSQLPNGLSSSSRGNGLADLNEPFKPQETNHFTYGHLRNGHIRDYGKGMNSSNGREHVPIMSLLPDENGKPKYWPNQPLRIDHYNGTYKSPIPFNQPAKPMDALYRPMMGPTRTFIDLEADTDTTTSHETSFASHQLRQMYPYNPLDSALPWNHLHSSWQNPNFGFPQKVATPQRYQVLNPSDTPNGFAQKQSCLRDQSRLQYENDSRFNPRFGSTTSQSNHNMFYNECSSSKLSGTVYNYPNGGRSDSNGGSEMKIMRDLNLNVTHSDTPVVDVRKDEGQHLSTLPWLITPPKSICNWNLNDVPSSSSKPDTEKIDVYINQSSAETDKVHKVMMFDINEPCDPLSEEEEKQTETTTVSVSNNICHFDLNMSVSEEDEDRNCSIHTSSRALMIDLEAPPESDDEENETLIDEAAEAIVAISSSKVVTSSVASSDTIILHWFADTINTHKDDLDKKTTNHRSIEDIDDFESMTLQLREITEEEYMPKPLVPEELKLDEGTSAVTSQRPRRGNARKGKQKRDFQRDILPGLLSLSKHEIVEDVNMFDGFMRAIGSSWTPSGLGRKKTGTRGRPRKIVTEPVYCPSTSVQQNGREVEMGLEDRRGFTGWGVMTRRPRRQRCPNVTASNQRSSPHAPFT